MTAMLKLEVAGKPPLYIRNREPGDLEASNLAQAVGRTDGTQVFAYDMGLRQVDYTFTLDNVTRDQLEQLQAFFDDDAQGTFNYFTITVPPQHPAISSGSPRVIANCRFRQNGIQGRDVRDGWYTGVTLRFYTESEGPTGPPVS